MQTEVKRIPGDPRDKSEFRAELCSLINRHSMENGSNTPDFILAEYLSDCLAAFDKAVARRTKWYAPEPDPNAPAPPPMDSREPVEPPGLRAGGTT